MRISFPDLGYTELARAFLLEELETCAILLGSISNPFAEESHLLIREIHMVPEQLYAVRTTNRVEIKPEYLIPLVQKARQERLSVVFVHSHPFSEGVPSFSAIDDEGEKHLAKFLNQRIPNIPHAAIVLGPDGCSARCLGTQEPARVIQVGRTVEVLCDPDEAPFSETRWDRQVRAFGVQGQSAIRKARIAIVGLGGTGSVVAQQLAHLGVSEFLLIDPDTVDETNLNRLVGAKHNDIGTPKTSIAARHIQSISPQARINSVRNDVTFLDVASQIIDLDAVFSCTDSHASRALLNQLAYQYYVPLFDVGVGIVANRGEVTHISGRVQMAAPGLPCLVCGGVIDSVAVRRELQTEIQRAADPYITGFQEPQPAVISLNSTVASLAVTMFINALTPIPGEARLQYYNGITGTVRAATLRSDPSCVVCSKSGALGLGSHWSLPGRVRTP